MLGSLGSRWQEAGIRACGSSDKDGGYKDDASGCVELDRGVGEVYKAGGKRQEDSILLEKDPAGSWCRPNRYQEADGGLKEVAGYC